MKRVIFCLMLCVIMEAPALSVASFNFSTIPGHGPSWTLAPGAPGTYTLTFDPDARAVATTDPDPDALLHDLINLPVMTISNIVSTGASQAEGIISATNMLRITSDAAAGATPAGTEVFRASVKPGGAIVLTSNVIAFDPILDDLDMDYYLPGYSAVLDDFAVADGWLGLDWSFSGTKQTTGSLYNLVMGNTTTPISGTIDGQVSAVIPEPASLILGSIGVAIVGATRRRRMRRG